MRLLVMALGIPRGAAKSTSGVSQMPGNDALTWVRFRAVDGIASSRVRAIGIGDLALTASRRHGLRGCDKLLLERIDQALALLRELDPDDDGPRPLSDAGEAGWVAALMIEPSPHLAEGIAKGESRNPD